MSVCSNCAKEFPPERLQLHEAYCLKYMVRCPDCPELVDTREMARHKAEEHQLLPCPDCKAKLKPAQLKTHSCKPPTQFCSYCQVQFLEQDISAHVKHCSARTRQCPSCMRFISVANLPTHACASDLSAPITPASTPPSAPISAPPQPQLPNPLGPLPFRRQDHGLTVTDPLRPALPRLNDPPESLRSRRAEALKDEQCWQMDDDDFLVDRQVRTLSGTIRASGPIYSADFLPVTTGFGRKAQ